MSTKPQVLAWITCDSVYVDPATGKHTLLGIFSNLRAKEFPVVHPRMIWFLSFSDLTQGKHHLKISIGISMDFRLMCVLLWIDVRWILDGFPADFRLIVDRCLLDARWIFD